jgi:hypothetical protein
VDYIGEVITGPENGHIAVVTNGTDIFEIHALADRKNREFYSRPAAEGLAAAHAGFLNRGNSPTSSFVRR